MADDSGVAPSLVSVITSMRNSASTLDEYFAGVVAQIPGVLALPSSAGWRWPLEVSLYDDASTDGGRSVALAQRWAARLHDGSAVRAGLDDGDLATLSSAGVDPAGCVRVIVSDRTSFEFTSEPRRSGAASAADAAGGAGGDTAAVADAGGGPSSAKKPRCEPDDSAAAAAAHDDGAATSTSVAPASSAPPVGAGEGRNRAIARSTGTWLCIADADDVMLPGRIAAQISAMLDKGEAESRRTLLGANFVREPAGSTRHYTAWANALTDKDLHAQQFREVTIVQPTWFMHRDAFDRAGPYDSTPPGGRGAAPTPEDLLFFHAHLRAGGALSKVPRTLVMYRYSEGSVSWKVPRRLLLRLRVRAFEERILATGDAGDPRWLKFTIWGAGRDGRQFYGELLPKYRARVAAFCDVDPKKLAEGSYWHVASRTRVPVIPFQEAKAPLVLCVAMGRTNGEFEANVASLGLTETVDYWHFN